MMNQHLKNPKKLVLSLVAAALITFVLYYLMLPPLSVYSRGFWLFLLLTIGVFTACLGVFKKKTVHQSYGKNGKFRTITEYTGFTFQTSLPAVILLSAAGLVVAVLLLGGIFSSTVFNARAYAGVITVRDSDFKTDMPETTQVTNIALMDTDSARILGNRELGALSGVVSQFVVSETYTQINYRGVPKKVANLEYDGFFKWLNNRATGIPGYIMVDPVNNYAEYNELPAGVRYAESAYFSEDLARALRFAYPTKIFGNISFEVDEGGNVFYIVSCMKPKVGLFGALDVSEVILFNPVDGTHHLFSLDETPTWLDIVYDGYLTCEKYDWYGVLSGGFINSIIGNRGCKQTTDDFGYIMLNDDVWYFTGVTSVTGDASNIGFILSNARTGEYKFYPVIGAEEHSAMGAAMGEVQEKRYVASFPSLVNIAGQPSYIMVLKDDNGLVKLYALVNVQQYNLVATGETQSAAISAYVNLLAQNGIDTSGSGATVEREVTIASLRILPFGGGSTVYITGTDGILYKMEFDEKNEGILLKNAGDVLHVVFSPTEIEGILLINAWH